MQRLGLSRRFSRRSIVSGSVVLAGAVIAACAPAAPPTNTPAPAKPAEAPKPAAPAPAAPPPPTAAPAATKPAEPTQPAAAPTTAPAAAAPAKAGQVELRIHDWEQDPKDEFYGPLFKKFEEQNPTIKIKREWFPRGDMHAKQLALAATGQIGDTARINVAVNTKEMVNKGLLTSLTPFINKDTRWNQNDQKQFWPGNIANYMFKGEQWGYPVVGHPGCIHHYVNLDHAEKQGVKLPVSDGKWTLEEAVAAFQKLQVTSAGRVSVYGVQPCLGGEGAVGVMRMFGGDYYSEDGTKALVGTPESIKGIEWLADLFQKHKVAIPLEAKADAQQVFPGGTVAVTVLTAFAAGGAFPRTVGAHTGGGKFKWAVLPPPVGPSGKRETQVSSDGYGMTAASKNKDQAWEVVKLYGSREHGFNRFKLALGSPGSRYDIWGSDDFKKEFPTLGGLIWDTLVDPAKNPPLRPWNHPQNGRFQEADTAINNILQDVWIGAKKPAEAAAAAQVAAQAIMDKPPI